MIFLGDTPIDIITPISGTAAENLASVFLEPPLKSIYGGRIIRENNETDILLFIDTLSFILAGGWPERRRISARFPDSGRQIRESACRTSERFLPFGYADPPVKGLEPGR